MSAGTIARPMYQASGAGQRRCRPSVSRPISKATDEMTRARSATSPTMSLTHAARPERAAQARPGLRSDSASQWTGQNRRVEVPSEQLGARRVRMDCPGVLLTNHALEPDRIEHDQRMRFLADDHLGTLGATRGLAAYPIVQEALTNATKHAPGRPVVVRVGPTEGGTTVIVRNDGPSSPAPGPGFGSGLRVMRERAESIGGQLTAGPTDGGWLVEAVLP